jgi:hypothetical protein
MDMETLLTFVGIPVAVLAGVAALVFAGSARRNGDRRYRPGRPFDFQPVWFLAPHATPVTGVSHEPLGAGAYARALPSARRGSEWPAESVAHSSVTGGASDRW